MFANRNGFFYTLDRTNGKVILAKPFVATTWAKEIGADGRPMLLPGHMPDEKGSLTCPGHHRRHQLLSAQLRSGAAAVLRQRARSVRHLLRVEAGVHAGRSLHRRRRAARARIATTRPTARFARSIRRPAIASGSSSCRRRPPAGILTTASGLLFGGDNEGNLLALDSRSGKLLWSYQMGSNLHGTSPTTYMLDGRQHLLVPAGTTLTAWALPDVKRVPSDAMTRAW